MIDAWTAVWIVLILFMSQTVQAVTGFGLGIVAMSMFPLVLASYTDGVCIAGMVSMVGSTVIAIRYRRHINFKLALPALCGYFVFALLATWLLASFDGRIFKRAMGVMLVLFAVYSLFFSKRMKIKPSPKNGVIAGSLGGLTGGLFSMGGPPVVAFMLSATDDNLAYLATIQFYFTVCNAYTLVMRLISGIMTVQAVYYSLLGLIGIAAGLLVGGKIFKLLNRGAMQKAVYVFMMVMGVWIAIIG